MNPCISTSLSDKYVSSLKSSLKVSSQEGITSYFFPAYVFHITVDYSPIGQTFKFKNCFSTFGEASSI